MARMDDRMRDCIKNLMASGWRSEELLVDTASQLAGGDEAAKMQAQRVFDRHFKIMDAI